MNSANGFCRFDEAAARVYPKIICTNGELGRPISQFDAMIAAIARSRRAALVTRNTDDAGNASSAELPSCNQATF
jgi:predicted nucleic acid-binding protein